MITRAKAADTRILQSKVTMPRHVVHRAFPSETVILNLETGRYHGVNPTGGRMLAVLAKRGDVRSAAEALAEEFGQPLAQVTIDLCAFTAELAARGLIELEPTDARA